MSLPSTDIHGHSTQPKVVITGADGATAEIHLHGAHVTSWKPAGKGEQLFLSAKSEFGGNAAIRGGVPVIFPQFSLLGPLPRHGFVRNAAWDILHQAPDEVTMVFTDTPETRDIWPHAFRLEFSARLEPNRLEMRLHVVNTGTTPFAFASALHTYLRVDDIAQTTVEGLKDLTFRDANTMVEHVDKTARITFENEVDRLYYGAEARTITVIDGAHTLAITASGFPDAVVWNPNKIKSDNMADMEADGWQRFVCVEAAAASNQIQLDPTEKWTGQQILSLTDH